MKGTAVVVVRFSGWKRLVDLTCTCMSLTPGYEAQQTSPRSFSKCQKGGSGREVGSWGGIAIAGGGCRLRRLVEDGSDQARPIAISCCRISSCRRYAEDG
jgi:hypothetical protein